MNRASLDRETLDRDRELARPCKALNFLFFIGRLFISLTLLAGIHVPTAEPMQ